MVAKNKGKQTSIPTAGASSSDESSHSAPLPSDSTTNNSTLKKRNPARTIGRAVLGIFVVVLAWYALADRLAPHTSRGFIAGHISQLSPRVSGRVNRVIVEDNALVKQGDPLFTLAPRTFQLAVDMAKVQLAQATKAVGASSAQLSASQAEVAKAKVTFENTQRATDRIKQLAERGVVSRSELDNANASLKEAKAALSKAQSQSNSLEKQLGKTDLDNTEIQAATVRLEQAHYDLISAQVKAPRNGVVTNLRLTVGQYVAAGHPAMTFIESENHWISAHFRENQLVKVAPQQKASVVFDALPGKVFKAEVTSVGWGINPGVSEAGGLLVNQKPNQWFEPARRMPVHIVLTDDWPLQAKVGGKVNVLIYTSGKNNPISWLAMLFQWVESWLTVFY